MAPGKNVLKAVVLAVMVVSGPRLLGAEKPDEKANKTVYDYSLADLDGKEVLLSAYKGKVLVIVNLASQSIFHEQNAMLEELQKTYKDQGLVVVGVPSNDFGAQEPGTEADIQKTYKKDLHLSFPVFSRISVRGKDQVPLYAFLTEKKGLAAGDVHWSYTKFVVDRTGKVVARFEPHVLPNAPELRVTIEDVLAGKFKPPARKDEDDKKETGGEENMAR